MEICTIDDLRMQYRSLCEHVVKTGAEVEPRGVPTYELTDVALVLPHPECATFPAKIGRKASPAILSAELMQWVAGVSDLAQLNSVSAQRFRTYSDDGYRLYGAYGPRAYRGLERAVRVLQSDTLTRQASVSLWRSLESDETKDLPCTLSWSFKIRDDKLEMMTVMRSNDVWTGVAYDVPSMARIQSAVAWALNVEAGRYTHVAQSLHVYDSDVAKINGLDESPVILDEDDPAIAPLLECDYVGSVRPYSNGNATVFPTSPIARWTLLRDGWAYGAARAGKFILEMPPEFAWYAEHLAEHPGYEHFCESCRYFLPSAELFCADPIAQRP